MPYVCCVPGCRGNYKDGPKVHAFKFPNNRDLCKRWVDAIPRSNFFPTKHNRVCELHFVREKIIASSTAQDSRTGQSITINLKIPKLASDAVPTLFPKCQKYVSKSVKRRLKRDKKFELTEQDNFGEIVVDGEKGSELDEKAVCYENFDDFLTILNSFELPLQWNKIITHEKVTFFKLIESPGPVITYSLVVNSKLKVETFLYGREFPVYVKKNLQTVLKTPFLSNNFQEVKYILREIDKRDELDKSNSKENKSHHALSQVLNIIDSLISENNEYENTEKNNVLSFISEQLKLLISRNESYRYSNNSLIVASILHTVSPRAYNFLRHAHFFILPHPSTITSICSPLLTDSTFEEKHISLKYANDIFRTLTEKDKHVILLIDEIHFNPFLDDKGGKSALAFTLTSVKSNFKEVVHISPVAKIDHETVFFLVKTIIIKLEQIGYNIFCVISDNDAVKSKGVSQFVTPNQLSIVYPHPVDKSRPLFYLFDSVHLLKSVKCDWLNSTPEQSFHYPDLETGIEKVADFNSLKELHRLERDKLLKHDHSLSLKALFPTNIEGRDVALALNIFNPFIVQALTEFGSGIDNAKETAVFINIILTWWKIVNVNEYKEAITSDSAGDDQKIVFLEKMLDWLSNWKQDKFSGKLSTGTHGALTHTIYGLLEVTKYCLNELRMGYILLGKFQTDDLEYRFGKFRQLIGCHRHFSGRQLYESGKKLKIRSRLTLTSQTFGDIQIKKFCASANEPVDLTIDEKDTSLFNPCLVIEESELETKHDLPVLIYLTGYCCRTVLNSLQCNFCEHNLVYAHEMAVDDDHNLVKKSAGGKLLFPQEFSVQAVRLSFVIFNKIISKFEEDFSFVSNKRRFLVQFIFKYAMENACLYDIPECRTHPTENVTKIFLASVSNILLQNYSLKTRHQLNKIGNKSRTAAHVATSGF